MSLELQYQAEGVPPIAGIENVEEAFGRVMEYTGFYKDGTPLEGVVSAISISAGRDIERSSRYAPILDAAKLNATAIYEIAGAPCIYFTRLDDADPSDHRLSYLQNVAWNHGLAPLLWVVTPTQVRIYSCFSRPKSNTDHEKHLIQIFEQTAEGLEQLNTFAGRMQIENGHFWTDEQVRRLVNRRQRVDSALLSDLAETVKLLTDLVSGADIANKLPHSVAHRLLGRCIFAAYLKDRSIVKEEFLQSEFGASDWTEILDSPEATYKFFDWIRTTFNGDLFPIDQVAGVREQDLVTGEHLKVIQLFLRGWDMQRRQGRLWPYRFDVLPVELISSIYEMFAHSSDPDTARKTSTHYTPLNLVDLILGQVFPHLDAASSILDLSCGSGVFLVESLRRLVAKRAAAGEQVARAMIRDTLYEQIYGVDISPGAIQIAAFSLYLTALELDPDPQPLGELKFQQLIGINLFAADAFDTRADFNNRLPFRSRSFDAVIGNPPWKKRGKNKSHVIYCNDPSRNYPLSFESPDQAFLYRAGDFVRSNGRIGMIVHSKPFFSQASSSLEAKAALFTRYKPDVLINLSNLRQDHLFPTATAPATVILLTARNASLDDSMSVVSPERSKDFSHHGIIEIRTEDAKRTRIADIARDRNALKILCWGTARDLHLVRRLCREYPPISSLVDKSSESDWHAGQGYKELSEKPTSDEATKTLKDFDLSTLQGKACLTGGPLANFEIDQRTLPPFAIKRFHRNTDQRIFRGPLTVVRRSVGSHLLQSAFSKDDVVYDSLYFGISIPRVDESWGHYLNGILNSSLASYFLFMTASVWGIERDEIQPSDLEKFPIPIPRDGPVILKLKGADAEFDAISERIISAEKALREAARDGIWENRPLGGFRDSPLQSVLDQAVFDIYKLDEDERTVVNDTLRTTIDIRMRGKQSSAEDRPSLGDLYKYAESVISVLAPWLAVLGEREAIADVFDLGAASLSVIRLSMPVKGETSSNRTNIVTVKQEGGLKDVLDRIASSLTIELAPKISSRRNLRLYVGTDLYIIKPAIRKYWTASAGLNDGDGIMAEHLRGRRSGSAK